MKSAFNRSILALAAILVVAGVSQASAQQKPLKKYESGTKDFWTNPPPDWFLGDETEAQKGQAPPSGPPTGASDAELAAMMKKIKLPEGFSIEVYASGVLEARQMAWGDKGTLFVGSFSLGNVYAIKDNGGKREVKTVLKGLTMPTGLAFLDGALYVVAINKLIKYENAEANLDNLGAGKVVYDDMPSYVRAWLEIHRRRQGWLVLSAVRTALQHRPPADQPLAGPPRRSQDRQCRDLGARRPQQRRRRRRSAFRAILVHRERARLDQRRHAERQAQHDLEDRRAFRLSLLPPGRHAGPEIRDGSQVLGVHAARRQSRRARGAARHEVLYRRSIPRRVQEQHPDRRARLLEPRQVPGRPHQARDRRCRRQERQVGDLCLRLARGRQGYLGRPADIVLAKDGSILVADDWAGAIYRISYKK